ncbi:hypothetical protein C1646_681886 [Rhizophagus diaphanus]|nr:hypothetical protein C1646_681886 [Rhizophagus diaphanus] [Rhizophagus sp. MUCL 43196]
MLRALIIMKNEVTRNFREIDQENNELRLLYQEYELMKSRNNNDYNEGEILQVIKKKHEKIDKMEKDLTSFLSSAKKKVKEYDEVLKLIKENIEIMRKFQEEEQDKWAFMIEQELNEINITNLI